MIQRSNPTERSSTRAAEQSPLQAPAKVARPVRVRSSFSDTAPSEAERAPIPDRRVFVARSQELK